MHNVYNVAHVHMYKTPRITAKYTGLECRKGLKLFYVNGKKKKNK